MSPSHESAAKIAKKSSEIWAVADILRGPFKPAEYAKVTLPFIVLRRLEIVFDDWGMQDEVIATAEKLKTSGIDQKAKEGYLIIKTTKGNQQLHFATTAEQRLKTLLVEPGNIKDNLLKYVEQYTDALVSIMDNFNFKETVEKLAKHGILYKVVERFANMDVSVYSDANPTGLTNTEMGYVFEDLLRRFSEDVNESPGEHYTPRSIVKLCVELAVGLDEELCEDDTFISVYDPTAGTGGMLTAAEEAIKGRFPTLDVRLYGQEINPESFAIAKADLLIKGRDANRLVLGNTLTDPGHKNETFTYILANPPYGVSWKNEENDVKKEAAEKGFSGRFGAGTPAISDGSLLFVQHMISKMDQTGSRIAVVLNGSPLSNGDAGSGESNIRKWILDNDLLVAIVALPTDMFYNTGIKTYIWVLDNTKEERRKGKVQFIDATSQFEKMKKSLGNKTKDMNQSHIDWVKDMYDRFDDADPERSKVLTVEDLMYRKIVVNVPAKDGNGEPVLDKKGKPVFDKTKKDTEKIPYTEDVDAYMAREVVPHVPDAVWEPEGKIGAEFPVDQLFYKHEELPSTEELDVKLRESMAKIQVLMGELLA
jgi:type I restriction enzyme M protein